MRAKPMPGPPAPAAGGCGRQDCCATSPANARPLLSALAWPLALGLGLAAAATALGGGDGAVVLAMVAGLILGARVASARQQPALGLTGRPADPIQSYCRDPSLSSEKEQQ